MWHSGHGKARPQQANLYHLEDFLKWPQAPIWGRGLPGWMSCCRGSALAFFRRYLSSSAISSIGSSLDCFKHCGPLPMFPIWQGVTVVMRIVSHPKAYLEWHLKHVPSTTRFRVSSCLCTFPSSQESQTLIST